ncbi:hypothetical protein GCM10022216_27560 [Sphingobacterium kyonggiense]|uniref:Uncharacterized protein n=1 Tax=Sphingobacterium kyonggiense TaxID=714075 RepID=A0ABP7Z0E7_9SPHI
MEELGFEGLTKIKDEPFKTAIDPDDRKGYIDSLRDNLLICTRDIPMQVFEDFETPTEKIFKQKFWTSEIIHNSA